VAGAAFGSLIVRYRSAGRDERQQIKWVAFAGAVALVSQGVAFGSLLTCGCDSSAVASVAFVVTEIALLLGVPGAIAIAILKYRLYDIDVIINRAVVYGLLAAAFTGVYVLVVVGIGSLIGYGVGDPLLTTIAVVAIALLFQPLRRRAQQLANGVVYGDRATPYQVLSEFADKMAGTYGLDDVLQRMASILAQGTGATRVDVWLRVGGELRRVAAWPVDATERGPIALAGNDQLPTFDDTRAVAVRHGDELFGALTLEKPRNEPLTPTEDKLLKDLASQAGLVLRNVRLTAELQANVDDLRASRRRLVEAQDEERRKIERNLHDGAQQHLVALGVKLGLAKDAVEDDPPGAIEMMDDLRGDIQDAIQELRALAHGIFPPLLVSATDARLAPACLATLARASEHTKNSAASAVGGSRPTSTTSSTGTGARPARIGRAAANPPSPSAEGRMPCAKSRSSACAPAHSSCCRRSRSSAATTPTRRARPVDGPRHLSPSRPNCSRDPTGCATR
jgi:signal transduction histidine kinase